MIMMCKSNLNFSFQDNVSAEVSFHMARPATVISNNSATSPNNSVLSNNSGLSNIQEKQNMNNNPAASPHNNIAVPVKPEPQPENGNTMNSEWTCLVDTATKAIYENTTEEKTDNSATHPKPSSSTANADLDMKSLLEKVTALEEELNKERKGKKELEQTVEHLKEENVRLKEESQTAAQQLRRFTEWFFQTIDKS